MSRMGSNEYRPDSVSPPGETLQEALESIGMTQADLAARSGRTPKLINEITKGKAPITPDTALQLERVLGISAEFWNNRERQYQETLARNIERTRLENMVNWIREFPLQSMLQLGWIRKRESKVDQLRTLLGFFGVATPDAWRTYWEQVQVSYRASKAFSAHFQALAAWLRKGELDAQNVECAPYNETQFRSALREIRRLTVESPEVFQPRIIELCAACGVAVAFVPELPKIRVSGATRWLSPTKVLIEVNLRYKKDDHFWFTVFHEAGHVLHDSKKMVFVDTEDFKGKYEDKANQFAADQLIPQDELHEFAHSRRRLSKAAIREFARWQGVAPGIVVGQLQHHQYLPYTHCNDLKRTFEWVASNE